MDAVSVALHCPDVVPVIMIERQDFFPRASPLATRCYNIIS